VPKAESPPPVTKEHLTTSANNLRQIGLAFDNYHDALEHVPRDITDKDGRPLLSWRVAILPYLEEERLYKQFKLDESWDSPNNKKLIEKMPKVYAPVRVKAKAGETFYQGFAGPKALFDLTVKPFTLRAISEQNGTSNTIAVVEAGEPVVWTKPENLAFNEKLPLPKLGGLFDGDFHALFCDGSVRRFKKTVPEVTLKRAIQPGNAEPIDFSEPRK
jgi:hypothetical protein